MIGKLKRVPLREVWKHEARDFTSWLQDNMDVLSEMLDIKLSNAEKEKPTGDFSVDLVAEDDMGNSVIIENQLEKSDHDHLGKLITYLTGIEAKIAIWIVAYPRPEHIKAVSWLNESSSASFYLIKVEGICIDNSPPAPLLTLIVGPSEETRKVGDAKKEIAERYSIRKNFWTQLLEQSKKITKLHANISPGEHGWIGTGAGKAGLAFNYAVTKNQSYIELYIDRGVDSEKESKAIYDSLFINKNNIEKTFGGKLEWQRLDGKRACRIRKTIEGGYRTDEKRWPAIQKEMIDCMIRLEKALKPHIGKLKV